LTKSFNFQLRLYRVTNLDLFDSARKPYDKAKMVEFFNRKEFNLSIKNVEDEPILERVIKHILKGRDMVD